MALTMVTIMLTLVCREERFGPLVMWEPTIPKATAIALLGVRPNLKPPTPIAITFTAMAVIPNSQSIVPNQSLASTASPTT